MYDDAFTIQKVHILLIVLLIRFSQFNAVSYMYLPTQVEDELLADFNFMAGMVASIQKFIRNVSKRILLYMPDI